MNVGMGERKSDSACDGYVKHMNDHVEQMESSKNGGRVKKNDSVEMTSTKGRTEKRSYNDLQKKRSKWSNVNCCTLHGHTMLRTLEGVNNRL